MWTECREYLKQYIPKGETSPERPITKLFGRSNEAVTGQKWSISIKLNGDENDILIFKVLKIIGEKSFCAK